LSFGPGNSWAEEAPGLCFPGLSGITKCRFSPFWEIAGTAPTARRRILLKLEDELFSCLSIRYSEYDGAMRSFTVRRGALLRSSIAPYRSFPPAGPACAPRWESPGAPGNALGLVQASSAAELVEVEPAGIASNRPLDPPPCPPTANATVRPAAAGRVSSGLPAPARLAAR